MSFTRGQLVRLSTSDAFKDSAGVATDPSVVKVYVRKPDGTSTTYAYNPGAIVKDGTGLYHLDVTVDQPGEWNYRFEGTGSLAAAAEAQLMVTSVF